MGLGWERCSKKCHHDCRLSPSDLEILPGPFPAQSCVACPVHTLSLVRSSGSRSSFHCHCSPLSFLQTAHIPKHVLSGPFSLSCLPSFCCKVLEPLFHTWARVSPVQGWPHKDYDISGLQLPPRPI